MEERQITKVALICSVTGILLLLAIVESQDSPAMSINKITNASLDQPVNIKGKIITLSESPVITRLQLEDSTGKIAVTFFPKQLVNLHKGDLISVDGVVKEFNNNLQVEAKQIKVV